MGLKVCVLASGSSGNCIYVSGGATSVLIDAGLSAKEIQRRLETIGVQSGSLKAVCLSHEHDDHTSGLRALYRKTGIELYGNAGTVDTLERNGKCAGLPWKIFTPGQAFSVGDLKIEPFTVPHDASDPVGFVVSCDGVSAGFVTDIGMPTMLVRERLRKCRLVVLEANHDETMLKDSGRPWALKQRIAGRHGHMSNRQAAELATEIAGDGLRMVMLAHVSSECNKPAIAERVVGESLKNGGFAVRVGMTWPDRVSELVDCGLL